MKKRKVVLSVIYSLGQISIGLILHPYQTMQNLIKDKIFIWMSLLPSFVLMTITILWKMIILPLVGIIFSCSDGVIIGCDWLNFVSNVITFYCIYWQILLFYLLLRFHLAFKGDNNE